MVVAVDVALGAGERLTRHRQLPALHCREELPAVLELQAACRLGLRPRLGCAQLGRLAATKRKSPAEAPGRCGARRGSRRRGAYGAATDVIFLKPAVCLLSTQLRTSSAMELAQWGRGLGGGGARGGVGGGAGGRGRLLVLKPAVSLTTQLLKSSAMEHAQWGRGVGTGASAEALPPGARGGGICGSGGGGGAGGPLCLKRAAGVFLLGGGGVLRGSEALECQPARQLTVGRCGRIALVMRTRCVDHARHRSLALPFRERRLHCAAVSVRRLHNQLVRGRARVAIRAMAADLRHPWLGGASEDGDR